MQWMCRIEAGIEMSSQVRCGGATYDKTGKIPCEMRHDEVVAERGQSIVAKRDTKRNENGATKNEEGESADSR